MKHETPYVVCIMLSQVSCVFAFLVVLKKKQKCSKSPAGERKKKNMEKTKKNKQKKKNRSRNKKKKGKTRSIENKRKEGTSSIRPPLMEGFRNPK